EHRLAQTDWLLEEWIAALGNSLELMTEARPVITSDARLVAPEIPAGAIWFSIALTLADAASVLIGGADAEWASLGKAALLAAGVTEPTAVDTRGAYLEIVTQSASGLAQSIAARRGKPVTSLPAQEVKLAEQDLSEAACVTPIEILLHQSHLAKLYVAWTHG